jgi:2-polyprenyl-6-hydroxyphenyl methylase / 3-demethylubiquinone-9 3-methyltransferase
LITVDTHILNLSDKDTQAMTPTSPHSSVDDTEIQRFQKVSTQWWDEEGAFKPLHRLNPIRIQYIRDCLITHFQRDRTGPRPLEGLSILDIGCGGGLVAEPLTRLGASVTGIDADPQAIEVATNHAALMELPISYQCTMAENLAATGQTFDAVLALEIVEHVADVAGFLSTCTQLVGSQGALILSTLNRTWKAYALAIVGAEYILNMVPKGTHDWHKFPTPAELANHLRPLGFSFDNLQGMSYSPLTGEWSLSSDLGVNYLGYMRDDKLISKK